MKRSLVFWVVCLMVVLTVLAACASTNKPPASSVPAPSTSIPTTPSTSAAPQPSTAQVPAPTPQKVWNLKMHIEQPTTAPMYTLGHQAWVDAVEKATNGAVKIQIFPSATLMATKDAFEGVKNRIADVAWFFIDANPGTFDLMEGLELPFLMTASVEIDSRVVWNIYQKYPEVQKQFQGVKVLQTWIGEPNFLCCSIKNFKTLSDFQGVKMRAVGPNAKFIQAAGGVPMNVPVPDAYLEMQKHVIDGTMCSSEQVMGNHYYEVAPYFTFVPLSGGLQLTIINNDVWNEMPQNIQQAIMSVSGETGARAYGRDVYDSQRNGLQDKIKAAGYNPTYYTVPQDELTKWKALCQPMYDDWLKKMADKGFTSAKQIFDDIPALIKQYSAK